MFFNQNRRQSNGDMFLSMLTNMLSQGDSDIINEENSNIKTNEFTRQVRLALRDIFSAEIRTEENNILSVEFPSGENFKLRIIKE